MLTSSGKSSELFLEGVSPFGLAPADKERFLGERLEALLEHHSRGCAPYAALIRDWEAHRRPQPLALEDYPFIPVTAFKEYDLRSTAGEGMSLSSSATTSGTASRVFADRATRKRQTASASRILADFIGEEKRPYIVFDLERTVRGTEAMSARGAAILSLAHLASEFHFVMAEREGRLEVDGEALRRAMESTAGAPFIAYGFTYILYQAHQELRRRGFEAPAAHPSSVLLHSGGWKRLGEIAVDKPSFNRAVAGVWGLEPRRVIDFYGAVEQVGVPYPDCPEGLKHVPYWAEVIIRRSDSLEPAREEETGLIQLLNCLPLSAPNHSVLTEDLGEIVLSGGCPCGRQGKVFRFKGRAPRSETRGCSDVARS
jgi:hypothetical protein